MHVNPTTKTHGSKKQYHNGSIGWAVHGLLQRLQRLILFKQLFERQKSQNHKLYKISLCHNVTRLHKGVMSLGQQDSGFLSQAQCIFHPQRFHLLPPLIPLLLTWLLPPTMPLVLSLLGSWQRRAGDATLTHSLWDRWPHSIKWLEPNGFSTAWGRSKSAQAEVGSQDKCRCPPAVNTYRSPGQRKCPVWLQTVIYTLRQGQRWHSSSEESCDVTVTYLVRWSMYDTQIKKLVCE